MQIKEHLNIARRSDSQIIIRLPTSSGIFKKFVAECGLQSKSEIYRYDPRDSHVEEVLGANWNKRICNSAGDFAEINHNTLTFALKQRRPLVEYTLKEEKFVKHLVHRGYMCVIKFVKDYGNKYDLM